jgi:hypothetical protein
MRCLTKNSTSRRTRITPSLAGAIALALLGSGLAGCGGSGGGKAARVHTSSTVPAAAHTATTRTSEYGGGTDDDIPAYGHNASPADRKTITALVKRYYAAAAARDGGTACSLLYPPLAASVPEDYGQAPGPVYARGKTCPLVTSKIFAHIPGGPADLASTEVTGVRVYRDHGFAELRSKLHPNGEIFVDRYHGVWTIGVLIGKERPPLPGGSA